MEDTTKQPAKTELTFGTDQIGIDTPPAIKLFYRWLMFVSSLWLIGIEPRFPAIPATVLHQIDAWLAIANFGVYYFCNCFGYKAPDKIDVKAGA